LHNGNSNGDRNFKVDLSSPSNATLANSTATVTITEKYLGLAALNGSNWLWLSECQPNPATTETSLRYQLPAPAKVHICITELNGKMVRNLLMSDQLAGPHDLQINTSDLAKGLYLVHADFDGTVMSRKLLIN
jgi:hypothetical protein